MAKPKLALIPSTVGGSVYSVLPSNGDGDFDFSRASAATRINAQGLIETVAVGDNRLNYPLLDGRVQTCPHLLLEPQRTNVVPYSEDFSNAGWTKTNGSINANDSISPDGTLNADLFIPTSANTLHYFFDVITASNNTYSASVFVKAKGYKNLQFYFRGGTGSSNRIEGVFDGDLGTTVFSQFGTFTLVDGKTENYGNGWYKISMTGNVPATETTCLFFLQPLDDNFNATFAGNGTDGILIYGAQLEIGSYPTSYIPTSGSATTRLAEVCDGSGNASTFNSSEGVLMIQTSALVNDSDNKRICISDGSTSNRVVVTFANNTITYAYISGVVSSNIVYNSDTTINKKYACTWKLNEFKFWANGVQVGIDTSGDVIPLNTLDTFDLTDANGLSPFYGKTKQLQVFDSALTDSELETLTSWMSFSDMAIDLNYTIQ